MCPVEDIFGSFLVTSEIKREVGAVHVDLSDMIFR